ncbi:MAG: hypothetical protein GX182_01935 [Firmicutes bacterium]|jgi:mono/diheme cytochrome c family protein|nr:hypothetical protein [Bacillota bacterium]
MRNLYWAAGVALLLFAALASWRGIQPGRMAEPSPAAEERGTVTPNDPRTTTMPGIPGITGPDQFAEGCVSCHTKTDGQDHRLSTTMQAMAKEGRHPDVTEDTRTKELPQDCARCHTSGGDLALADLLHEAHYEGNDNVFVLKYDGHCLNCHSLNRDQGVVDIKSGTEDAA